MKETIKKRIKLTAGFWLLAAMSQAQTFVAPPYLQVGPVADTGSLDILWQTPVTTSVWEVEVSPEGGEKKTFLVKDVLKMQTEGAAPRNLYDVRVNNLIGGKKFTYTLKKDHKPVFSAEGKALKTASQPYRMVIFGDIGAGTAEAKKMAQVAYQQNPDGVIVPGDIIYENGRVSEYDKNFWPVYNADQSSSEGAPLLRSIPFVAAPGNHDTEDRSFGKYPDILAYFQFWNQPTNGPDVKAGTDLQPGIKITDTQRQNFESTTKGRFPKMANFSMNYGNAHWLFIDSNPYVDFTNPELQSWIANDLKNSKDSVWKFVVFHHPGFNSSIEHYEQQHMRLLSPIFEKEGVDVVFNGHVHNYQRSFPLTFSPFKNGAVVMGGKKQERTAGRIVAGNWQLDHIFDGKSHTRPKGIIYIVTGAGGQDLYNPEQTDQPDTWQKFTDKFLANTHSLSVVYVNGTTFNLKQINIDGQVIDTFTITK